jgi:hypothetical protein
MRHLIADFDAGPKSASGQSVAALHECARIPDSGRLKQC